MGIRSALFDYGNTLVSTRLDWEQIIPESLDGLCRALQDSGVAGEWTRLGEDFLRLRRRAKRRAEREWIETPAVDSLRQALALQHVELQDPEILQRAVDAFFLPEERAYPIIVGIPETLSRLTSMGLKLGVVSNATCGRLIRRSLERRGLLDYFQVVVVSAEVGICKPSPAIVEAALSELNHSASEACLIGDRLDTDIAAAQRAGLKSVLTDFFGEHPTLMPHGVHPDASVHEPHELIEVIRDWMSPISR